MLADGTLYTPSSTLLTLKSRARNDTTRDSPSHSCNVPISSSSDVGRTTVGCFLPKCMLRSSCIDSSEIGSYTPLIDTGTEERAQVDLPQGPPKKFDTVTVSLRLVLGSRWPGYGATRVPRAGYLTSAQRRLAPQEKSFASGPPLGIALLSVAQAQSSFRVPVGGFSRREFLDVF